VKYIAIVLIRLYQLTFGQILPKSCRFIPSCSQYALTAIKDHGIAKGLVLSAWRILHCQPLCVGGWDPVPNKGVALKDALKRPHHKPECCCE
jgi:putative membrane protein insertion efficiency factor